MISYCQKCTAKDNCTQCSDGYYVKSDRKGCLKCSGAIAHCLRCVSESQCTGCESGFGVDRGGSCGACADMMEGCLVCDRYNSCSQCTQNFELQDGVCRDNGGGANVIAIALGAAGGVVVLVALGTRLDI